MMALCATSKVAAPACSTLGAMRPAMPSRVLCPVASRRSVLVRNEKPNKLAEAVDTVREKVEELDIGNVNNEKAEANADMSGSPTLGEAERFDGPLPETVNGRAAMIGVLSGLAAEFSRNVGLKQQIFEAPGPILATFVLIAVASAVPVFRGYTRKEKFANSFWSPKAENWNGRLAMLGFASILLTEQFSGKNTVEFWSQFFG